MSKEKGYIRLYRSITDNFLWDNNRVFDKRSAWIDLLLMASYQPTERLIDGILVKLERGELYASTRFLASRWKWSKDKVSRFLVLLETQGMVRRKRATNGTIILIEKYDYFQGGKDTDKDTNEDNDEPRTRTPAGTKTNKVKESNKSKKNIRGGGRIVEE